MSFPSQIVNVAYFQRKIQLSGFSAYPDGSSSQLIRISRGLLYQTTALSQETLTPANLTACTLSGTHLWPAK